MEADFHVLEVRIYKGKQADTLDPEDDEKIVFLDENKVDEPLIHLRVRTSILITLLTASGVGAQLWRVFF